METRLKTSPEKAEASKEETSLEEPILHLEDRKDAKFMIPNLNFRNLEKGCSDPPLYAVRKFLSEEECKSMIDKAIGSLQRSEIVEKDKPISNDRTSYTYNCGKEEIPWLNERIADLLNVSVNQLEIPQITNYTKGQFFKEHHDHFRTNTESGKVHIDIAGQRIGTVLMYLNEPESGGATNFKKLGFKVKPKTGSALIFCPATLDGRYDPLTLHEAEEIIEGEKWVCQVWVRQREFFCF
jgi:prolyl 4-hydroxylase